MVTSQTCGFQSGFSFSLHGSIHRSPPSSYSVTVRDSRTKKMAGNSIKSVAKSMSEFQYPWRDKLVKYKDELSKGVWGYWHLGAWKPLGISARRRARLRKEVLLAGQDWPFDPERKEMRTKRKGHKCDRISAEKRANTEELMKKMPQMLADYRKKKWEKKMNEEDAAAKKV
ncbi:hypothetical protein L2E82_36281 [Cichorium intybus]|uniref:Uncharacterized protein n=1 Tax=Cichorium intybus TaxID=13427 RepID=A0ACB9BR26_CICIN|nr:hypothetical protein L2E82_36281 [Cichorium intybus]